MKYIYIIDENPEWSELSGNPDFSYNSYNSRGPGIPDSNFNTF